MEQGDLDALRDQRRELGRQIRATAAASGRDLRAEDARHRAAAHSREHQADVKEIGEPPPIADPERREACRLDLHRYLLTYHPEAFPLAFGDDHLFLIEQTQRILLDGGQIVAAFPRGSGKTTIFQRAQIWAALYGHRVYPMLIAADDQKFRNLLRGIKVVLENNELLLADFPEVVHPIRALERIAIRANYQTCRREPTYMKWAVDSIVFPTIAESIERGNAGVVLGGGGLTGAAVRGGVLTLPSGQQVRPDAVLIDDPQTRKSAKSDAQNMEREDILNGDILGMAGPGKTIAAMCACTVIYRNDLADRLLDRERSTNWTAVKVPMIKSWPKNMSLWEEYDGVRRQEAMEEVPRGTATAFYAERRQAMDEDALTYWPARVLPGRLSDIQSAMDDYLADPRAFMAEKQNSPEANLKSDLQELNPLDLTRRTVATDRGQVPADATTITAHIDVQQRLLYWIVVAWTQSFSGTVIDYGPFPSQNRRHFVLREIKHELTKYYPGFDETSARRQAIADCIQSLASRSWSRADGADLRIDRGMIDARWKPEDVEAGVKASKVANWLPSYGVGIRAKDAPIEKWTKKRGVVFGQHCLIQKPDRRLFPGVFYDTNWWKSQIHQALLVPVGHQHAIAFHREARSWHQMLADHCTAERAVRVEARGRIVDEWDLPNSSADNHLWDCLVGSAVSASLCGISRSAKDEPAKQRQVERVQRRVSKLRV